MQNFKKILVPVDFEGPSADVTGLATDLARRLAGAVTLAHVYDSRGYALASGYIAYTDDERNRMIGELQRQLDTVRRELKAAGVPQVDTSLLDGVPATEILHLAHAGRFDLIVMGTHGKGGLWQKLLGSVAEDVLSEAPCPVVTVHPRESEAA
jgi:nucleotide-binding universal stress UspA family protein